MSKITVLNEKAIAVEAEDYFYEESLEVDKEPDEDGNIWLCYQIPDGFGTKSVCHKLPPSSWSILGRPEEITEEQWKGIVGIGYEDFKTIKWLDFKTMHSVLTATESGLSLLKSKGLSPESIIILIKQ